MPGAPLGFRAWRENQPPTQPPQAPTHDDMLWSILAQRRPPAADADLRPVPTPHPTSPAPLFPDLRDRGPLEVWTERELAGLHALHRLAQRDKNAPLARRAFNAARWHLQHTQPDNATNRPWATQVFLLLERQDNAPEARLYAETLIHNCMVTSGRPDPLSAEILRDAADALDADELTKRFVRKTPPP